MQQASQRVGVSQATLRSWADQGRVQAFRTPGGHRRFRERDLDSLASSGQETSASHALRVLANSALGRTRFEVTDGWLDEKEWYRRFPEGAREEHRDLGRQVIVALADLMPDRDGEEKGQARAAELGKAYGELNLRYEIALSDALKAFHFFRDSFIESLAELAESSPALDLIVLLRRASAFVDAMLLAMVEAYSAPSRRKGRKLEKR